MGLRPPPPTRGQRPRSVLATIASVGLLLWSLVFGFAFFGSLVKEWRSGKAFDRYHNWQGMPVSHADGLIVGVILFAVVVGGSIYGAWDRRRERRALEALASRRRE